MAGDSILRGIELESEMIPHQMVMTNVRIWVKGEAGSELNEGFFRFDIEKTSPTGELMEAYCAHYNLQPEQ